MWSVDDLGTMATAPHYGHRPHRQTGPNRERQAMLESDLARSTSRPTSNRFARVVGCSHSRHCCAMHRALHAGRSHASHEISHVISCTPCLTSQARTHQRQHSCATSSSFITDLLQLPHETGPIDLHHLALSRIATLRHFSASQEYAQLMLVSSSDAP